jgi:hypothetical protein
LASGVVGSAGALCWGKDPAVILLVRWAGCKVLLGTVGDVRRASETDLELGVGVEGEGTAISSETGLEFRIGIVCEDTELSLLCENLEMGEEEPAGAFNEVRRDVSDVSSGSLGCFLFFPIWQKRSDYE